MSPLDRTLHRIQRIFTLGVVTPPPDPEPVPSYPGQRPRVSTPRVLAAVAAAATLPIAFGAALIALRGHISQSISLLMVLPVLVAAANIATTLGRCIGP